VAKTNFNALKNILGSVALGRPGRFAAFLIPANYKSVNIICQKDHKANQSRGVLQFQLIGRATKPKENNPC